HRGIHALSERATQVYEATRYKVQQHLNAKYVEEIVFVQGTTEGINLVAQSFGKSSLIQGDEIIISTMEHHSNIVPWQMLAEQIGVTIKVIPLTEAGEINFEAYQRSLSSNVRLVAITHVSNVLGTLNPIKKMTELAHQYNAKVLVDGAQAFGHIPVDVQALDCDFYVFSAHKAYGPTGIGVLYGKKELLEKMPPYQGGGNMIESVSFTKTTYAATPYKFEAGTPNIAASAGLSAALDYIAHVGVDQIYMHEQLLLHYAQEKLREIYGLRIIGDAVANRVGVISFILDDVHPHDLGTILDREGIAIRAGHHCAMPLMEYLNLAATARLSLGLYNTKEDIDALIEGILLAKRFFA
ncbi:MAG TPA: cysteine desulfurase, partial [Gammaproteobacteria bacterium]|nr:cysteine desulfurase [Gammaproteobacteria bacterium]